MLKVLLAHKALPVTKAQLELKEQQAHKALKAFKVQLALKV